MTNTVCTLYELRAGDDTVAEGEVFFMKWYLGKVDLQG